MANKTLKVVLVAALLYGVGYYVWKKSKDKKDAIKEGEPTGGGGNGVGSSEPLGGGGAPTGGGGDIIADPIVGGGGDISIPCPKCTTIKCGKGLVPMEVGTCGCECVQETSGGGYGGVVGGEEVVLTPIRPAKKSLNDGDIVQTTTNFAIYKIEGDYKRFYTWEAWLLEKDQYKLKIVTDKELAQYMEGKPMPEKNDVIEIDIEPLGGGGIEQDFDVPLGGVDALYEEPLGGGGIEQVFDVPLGGGGMVIGNDGIGFGVSESAEVEGTSVIDPKTLASETKDDTFLIKNTDFEGFN